MARKAAAATGSAWTFFLALLVVAAWGITGPVFGSSDTWRPVINTDGVVVTYQMVFLIQNTKNRDSRALHLKLGELLKPVDRAHAQLIEVENSSDEEFDGIEYRFKAVKKRLDKQIVVEATGVRAGTDGSRTQLSTR